VSRAEEDLHDGLLERVARRYFLEGMLQNDIAAAEHLSRPSVSGLLAEAGARGVVQFRVGPPVDRVRELETELRRRTGLRRCVVATNNPPSLSTVAESLVAAHGPDLTVVDLMGCLPGGRSWEPVRAAEGSGPNTAQLMATRLDAVFRALPAGLRL
jgi:hypothetical protein